MNKYFLYSIIATTITASGCILLESAQFSAENNSKKISTTKTINKTQSKMTKSTKANSTEVSSATEKEVKNTKSSVEEIWKKDLDPLQEKVCKLGGTERAFTGKYNKFYEAGIYNCSICREELFTSETKFDSGTGWPSFYKPASESAISEHTDNSFGMTRTEVKCGKCGSHLGHVFPDGPKPTGLRYCINSVCLEHEEPDE